MNCQPDFWANIPELWHFWKLLSALLEKQSTQCGILRSLGVLGAVSLACDYGIGDAADPAKAVCRSLSGMWAGAPLPVFVMSINGRNQLPRGKQGTVRGHCLVLDSSLIQPRQRHERAKVWVQTQSKEQGHGSNSWVRGRLELPAVCTHCGQLCQEHYSGQRIAKRGYFLAKSWFWFRKSDTWIFF